MAGGGAWTPGPAGAAGCEGARLMRVLQAYREDRHPRPARDGRLSVCDSVGVKQRYNDVVEPHPEPARLRGDP